MTKKTIEQAYEELRQIIDGGSESFTHDDAVEYLKEKLAHSERELVTWRNAAIRVGEDLCSVGPLGYYDMNAKQWLDWALNVVTVHAPPPQRTWVGLTEEEKQTCIRQIDELGKYSTHTVADDERLLIDVVESKLRSKNA